MNADISNSVQQQQTQIPTENQSTPKIPNRDTRGRNTFIAIIGVVMLVLVVGTGAYYSGIRKGQSVTEYNRQPIPTLQVQPTSIPNETTTTTASFPVIILKTVYGIDGVPTPSYSPTVTVIVPQSLADQLSAYGGGNHIIVGPKGWTGESSVGADGNTSITLYPTTGFSEKGQKIGVFIASTGTGIALWDAAPYNSWVRDHWQELGGPGAAPTPPVGMKTLIINSRLIKYSFPMVNNLETNGIAFSDAQEHTKDGMWAFSKMEVTLPQSQHEFSSLIIDYFIDRQGLK